MIIFINGSFGVGKTTIANELVKKLPNALLYDPEEVGGMLHNILKPIENPDDFQDYSLWKTLVPQIAGMIKDQYGKDLIIPMTIWNKDYFQEIADALKNLDENFYHFCLVAPIEEVHQRIEIRGEQGKDDWIYRQTTKCYEAFQSDLFEEKIDTLNKTPEEITRYILSKIKQ